MDHCAWMAKKALLRPIGEYNAKPLYAKLEAELLDEVNNTGIGPLGMGDVLPLLAYILIIIHAILLLCP